MAKEFDRRAFLARSAATGATVAVAGALGEVAFSGAAGAVVTGGTLNVGLNAADTGGYGPAFGKMDTAGFCVLRAVCDPLMVVDTTGTPQPYLAQSVTPNASYTVWTVKLRSGVTFHDGSPLNADALVANVNAWLNPGSVAHYAVAPLVAGATKVDNLTVNINLKLKWVSFPHTLSEHQIAYIVSKATCAAGVAGLKNPVGTGPFKWHGGSYDFTPTGTISLSRNNSYWRGGGLPYLEGIVFHPIPDGGARLSALQGGQVDMVHLSEPQQILTARSGGFNYQDDSSKAAYAVRLPAANSIQLNCRKSTAYGGSPFVNVKARQALWQAIDRKSLNALVNKGVDPDANGVYPVGSVYSQAPYLPYSPATAKSLAKAAGLKSFKLMIVAGSDAQLLAGNQIVKYCAAAGITCNLVKIDQSTLINNALVGNYDATLWTQFGGCSPDLNYPWWTTTDITGFVSVNMAGNADPKIEAGMRSAMGQAKSAATIKAWSGVAAQINKDIPYVFTDYQVYAIASKPTIHGWKNPTLPGGKAALNQEGGLIHWAEISKG